MTRQCLGGWIVPNNFKFQLFKREDLLFTVMRISGKAFAEKISAPELHEDNMKQWLASADFSTVCLLKVMGENKEAISAGDLDFVLDTVVDWLHLLQASGVDVSLPATEVNDKDPRLATLIPQLRDLSSEIRRIMQGE
jgi:hypothetical protein